MKALSHSLYHPLTLLAIALLLWGTLAFPSPTPARAATLTVNTLSDENDHSCSDGDCSLRDAIETAAPGEEIGFAAALGGGTISLASTLEINKSLTISSTVPITISGNYAVSVFTFGTQANATLGNLVITKGRTTDAVDSRGGGIYNQGVLTIFNCKIRDNGFGNDIGSGGGIYNAGMLTINNSEVSANSPGSSASGGGIWNSGSLTINASNISDNHIEHGQGGGIFTSGSLTINDSVISGNRIEISPGSSQGGGIYNQSTLIVHHSTFSNNYAIEGGGGIVNSHWGIATIDSTSFSNNDGGYFSYSPYLGGGAIWNEGKLTLSNSSLFANRSAAGGCAISNQGYLYMYNNTLKDNCYQPGQPPAVFSGIYNHGFLDLRNNIVANTLGTDCTSGSPPSFNVNNLIEDGSCNPALSGDPLLGEATGSPAYFPLLPGSPAIDAGDNASCWATDQGGLPRPQGVACDIGAVEMVHPTVTIDVFPMNNVPLHSVVTYTITLHDPDPFNAAPMILTDTFPAEVDFAQWIQQPAGAAQADDHITWNGTLTPNSAVMLMFTARHTGWFGDVVTNTVQVYSPYQTASAQASFTVRTNAAPVAVPDTYTAIHTAPLEIPTPLGLLANDRDPDGDPIHVSPGAMPITGTLEVQDDGSFIYTPTLGFIGPLTFTYLVSDKYYTDTADVLINVTRSADLAISQQVAQSGTAITYTVAISNLGPEDAAGAIFDDQISPSVSDLHWNCTSAGGAACPAASGSGVPSKHSLPVFPPNGQVTYVISGQQQASPIQGNWVTVTPPHSVSDPDLDNNRSVLGKPFGIFLPLITTTFAPSNSGDRTWSDEFHANAQYPNEMVTALALDSNGDLYIGGGFTLAGGTAANRIAHWDGVAWHPLGAGLQGDTWCHEADCRVSDIVIDNHDNLYVNGDFTMAGGSPIQKIARWDGTSWHSVGDGISGRVSSIAMDNATGNLYVAGHFTPTGEVNAFTVAMWDGATWHPLGGGVAGGGVATMASDGRGNLYVAGNINWAGGVNVNYIARWDGTAWHALGSGMNWLVSALAVDHQGNLYAGGSFATAGGVYAPNIAMWDGSAWHSLGSGTNGSVTALSIDSDDDLYVGGKFTVAGWVNASHVAHWDGAAWHSVGNGTGPGGMVAALALDQYDNLYVGGRFQEAGGKPSPNVAKWAIVPDVGNRAWHDRNANGLQDENEPGVNGVLVRIYDHTGVLTATMYTHNDGLYTFENLWPGTYTLEFIPPAGYTFTTQDQGSDNALDSDADPLTGYTIPFTLTTGQNDLSWDAGLVLISPVASLAPHGQNVGLNLPRFTFSSVGPVSAIPQLQLKHLEKSLQKSHPLPAAPG